MKNILAIVLILASGSAYAARAMYVGETVTGQTKQCYYEYFGSRYTITVGALQWCPLSIEV